MPRQISLRQVEAFKALIENGTVSRAAAIFNVSQPAMSKLIAHFEEDTGLKLFDRLKGRLAPTEQGMRLYEEIDRIFAGIRQVESAVDLIRREEQGQLSIGVMPALSGLFIQRATMAFLKERPHVFCSVQSRSSEWIVDWLVTRKIDLAIVSSRINNPYIRTEPLMQHPLVCIMPLDHPLTRKQRIVPRDLSGVPFVSFNTESYAGRIVGAMLEAHDVGADIVLVANISPTICEFVAAGLGVSLVHPLMISGWEKRLAVRHFSPAISHEFHLSRSTSTRNAHLVEPFLNYIRSSAKALYDDLFTSEVGTALQQSAEEDERVAN